MSESRVIITAQADQAVREFERLRAQATGSLQQLGDLGERLDNMQETVGDVIKGILAFSTVNAFVGMIDGSIQALDNLKDLSTTTKITVEDLSGLKLASEQSGADLEGTAAAIGKLTTNMGKYQERFARLGITAKDPLEAFKQFADVFSAVDDAQLRAALSAEALGKSWGGAAPLLAEGSARIGDMVAKGKAMSNVTSEMAGKADEFNDRMATFKAVVEGAKMSLANEMLPALVEITTAIETAYAESGKLQALWVSLGSVGAFLFTDEFSSATVKIKNLQAELGDLKSSLALSKMNKGFGAVERWVFGESTGALEKKIKETNAQIQALQAEIDKPNAAAAKKAATDRETAEKKKLAEQTKTAEAAAAEFLKLNETNTKATLAAQLNSQKAALDAERAARASALAEIAELNRQGLVSDSQYYAAKRAAILAAGADTARAKDLEVANLRAAAGKDVADQIAVNGKIAVLNREKNVALRDSLAQAELLRKQYIFDSEAPIRAAQAASDAEINTAEKEAAALKLQYENYGKLPAAITAANIAKLEGKLIALETNEGTEAEISSTRRLIAALQDKSKWEGKVTAQGAGLDVARAHELLDVMTALDDMTQQAATGMANSFGEVGSAIGGLTTALSGYGRAQAAIAAQLAVDSSAAQGNEAKLLKLRQDAAQKSGQAHVKSYGDMAGAAKGFFKDGTKGYGALQAAEKTFRAFEMAMAVKNMLVKSGLLQAFTGLFVSAKATETAATVASIGPDVAASQIKGQAAAVAGVATQAKGDPYTAWGRMAAMAATMAALGYIVSGGKGGSGGGQTAAEAQAQQGTGTVFGDSTAKSNSIGRSIELMQKNSAIELAYTGGMLSSLRAIEKSMSGLTNILLQTDGVANGTNMGIQEGTISRTSLSNNIAVAAFDKIMTGGLLGKLTSLWGSTKQNLVDSGIQIRGTVNQLQAGSGFNQYASIDTTKKSAFGLKKKTTNRVETQGLDANISAQFGLIFRDLETALGDAAVAVGGNAAQVVASLDSLKIDTKVSLKDLKGDDLSAALNAVLSKTMDQMAKAALPAFDQFREVGEGYAETVMRITANYVNLDSIMQSIGTTFGATGMVSLAARERLIDLAGGIDSLAAQTNSFAESFLTEAERIAPVRKYVTEQLAAMGLAGITTRDQFKSVVLGIDKTTAAGAAQYTQLLALSDAFAKAYAAAEDLTKSTQAIADERKDLLEELDALTMTEAQLLNKKRMALDASNRGLFDYVESMRAARVAQDAAKAGFTDAISRMKTFGDSIRTFRDGLTMGGLSTLTVEQQYAEARRQYGATRAAALAGDANAQGALSAAINSFLTISQKVNGSDSLYAADFAGAMKDSEELASWASDQVDVAKASLDALQQQVIGMNSLNLTVQTVADSVTNFTGAMLGVSATTGQPITAGTTGAANTEALVAQVRALTAEVAALRADQQRQTGAIIEAQVGAAQRAAETISTNARDVAVDTAWQARNSKVQLA